jgi:hypothetical protein
MSRKGDSRDTYHGIIVEESLRDPSVLETLAILGRKKGRDWTLLRVGIEERALKMMVNRLRQNLITVNGVPFYAHFYHPGELIVVFPERVFRVTPEKSSWEPVVTYGKSVGIPAEQLDFAPCRFEDETY